MNNRCKLSISTVVFDLDDVLIHEGFNIDNLVLCDDTIQILEYLHSLKSKESEKSIRIILATHNREAVKILKQLKINHLYPFSAFRMTNDTLILHCSLVINCFMFH